MNRSWRDSLPMVTISSLLLLAGCEWVDSAGDGSARNDVVSLVNITLDEQPIGGAVELLEVSAPRVVVANPEQDQSREILFDQAPLAEGVLDACLTLNGFTEERAVDTLADACASDVEECSFNAQIDTSNASELAIQLTVPRLRASVGRRHTVVVGRNLVGEDGASVFVEELRREVNFCLVAINEAPDAVPDTYLLAEGDVLEVDAQNGLLANDTDDEDIGNRDLMVFTQPALAPQAANILQLRTDGSFTYQSVDSNLREDLVDRFEYTVTDGQQSSVGEVSVRIAAANQAPVLLSSPEPLMGRVGREFDEDLSVLFEDPEGQDLSFSFDGVLPDEGDLELTEDGVLEGTPEEGDEGEYDLILIADDGNSTTETQLLLIIEEENLAPVFVDGSVGNRTTLVGRAINDVEPEFIDPEGDELTYSSVGADLPPGVSLDEQTGIVSGAPSQAGIVRNIVIQAEDTAGNTAESDDFFIRAR